MNLTIMPGVVVITMNPDWHRPFEVEREVGVGDRRYFLCRFTTPSPEDRADCVFARFGVATADGITVAWPILTFNGKEEPVDLVDEGDPRLAAHRCPRCCVHIEWRTHQRVLGPELVEVTYTCPKCGYVDHDVID